jgi:hypothetical protein
MAAGEDEAQAFIGNRVHLVVLFLFQLGQACEQLGLVRERAVAANAVDRPVSGGRDDPGGGIRGRSVLGPACKRGRERVLYRVLGEVEVTEDADQDRNRAAPLLTEEGLDR